MTKDLEEFVEQHLHAAEKDTALLPLDATHVAVSTGVASEKITAMFSDEQWFGIADLTCKDYNMATTVVVNGLTLPKHVCVAKEATANVVLAVSHMAIPKMMQGAKEIWKQYDKVDVKLIVFTPNEMKLWEGAQLLWEKLGITIVAISLVSQPMGFCGGMPWWRAHRM